MDIDYESSLKKDDPSMKEDPSVNEKILASILDDLIGPDAWEDEYKINVDDTTYRADAHICDTGILLEADEKQWHPWVEEDFDEMSEDRKERFIHDVRRTEKLQREGWEIVRIWENHLQDHRQKVKERLEDVIFNDDFPSGYYLFEREKFEEDREQSIAETVQELEAGDRVRISVTEDDYDEFEGTYVDQAETEVVNGIDITGERGSGPFSPENRFLIETVGLLEVGPKMIAFGVTTNNYAKPMGEVESLVRVEGGD